MEIDIEKQLDRFKKPKEKILTERNELLKMFVDRLNESRTKGGFKPLKAKDYAIMMARAKIISVGDLYRFYGNCNDAKNFSSYWWFRTKELIANNKKHE